MMKKIVFAEPIGISPEASKSFSKEMETLEYDVIFYDSKPVSQSELQQRIVDAEILVIANYPLAAQTLQSCPNLKLIAVAFTGVDHVPIDYCKENSISVCNAAGYSTNAVAELTITLAISLLRNVVYFDSITRKNGTRENFLGGELFGKTFGILGYGAIGKRVAHLAKAFGSKVIVSTRTPQNDATVKFVSTEDLFKQADIISLHVPATPETVGLVSGNLIKLMKPTSILINTARGAIVDYSALSKALQDGKISGAAIDVYEHEPPIESDHPILTAPNTILLPHIAYATKEAIALRTNIVLSNIKAWLAGSPQNLVF
jgi:D-3-phosphoglycerate dehydrogenase